MLKLFPLPLLGSGTSEVESLGSYLHRCAFEHGVYFGELVRIVFESALLEGKQESHVGLPKYFDVAEVIRGNKLSATMVAFFESATGQPLMDGTFLRLGDAVGRSTHVVGNGFRWCPECFRDDEILGRPAYFRLIWHLYDLTHCPLHRSPLANSCSGCGCGQISYKRVAPLGLCQVCGSQLSRRASKLKKEEVANSWEHLGGDVLQLIADLVSRPEIRLSKKGLNDSLSHLLDYYWKAGRENEFYALLSRDELLAILFEQKSISLKVVRRLALRLGISIFDLVSGNAHNTSAVLESRWFHKLPKEAQVVPKPPPKNHSLVLRRIQRLVNTHIEPLSKKEIARRLDVSIGYLDYQFPALMKDIAQRHQMYRQEQQQRKQRQAQASALAFFVDGNSPESPKSRKGAYRALRAKTGLPKFMLKRAIQAAYGALMT